MAAVVKTCPIPICVLGGARQGSDDDALEIVAGAASAGAAGVFFGRNLFQSRGVTEFLQRALEILHRREFARLGMRKQLGLMDAAEIDSSGAAERETKFNHRIALILDAELRETK